MNLYRIEAEKLVAYTEADTFQSAEDFWWKHSDEFGSLNAIVFVTTIGRPEQSVQRDDAALETFISEVF